MWKTIDGGPAREMRSKAGLSVGRWIWCWIEWDPCCHCWFKWAKFDLTFAKPNAETRVWRFGFEIFHIQKIFSCKVAHSPIVNINCHIAILFKMCSECTNQYPRRRKKKNQHQQGGGGEETLVLQEDDQLLTMQLPLSLWLLTRNVLWTHTHNLRK